MPQCCNTYRHIVHIVKFHTIDHFKIFKVTSKYYRHFSSPLWLGWFLLIRTYSLKLNFCSHCVESYHKSISNISNKLFPAKVHHNLFNLEWKEKGSCSHLYRKNMLTQSHMLPVNILLEIYKDSRWFINDNQWRTESFQYSQCWLQHTLAVQLNLHNQFVTGKYYLIIMTI